MLLSEAFRCGAAMMLRFTSNVERTQIERDAGFKVGRVPFAILQLARDLGTPLPDADSGVLKPKEAIPLYAKLTGFPDALDERVRTLVADRLLTMERACYLVQHGVWTVPELEGLIRGCPYPDLVLAGELQPEDRHLYNFAQIHARTALLGGVLDRALLFRDPSDTSGHVPEAKPVKGRAEGAKVTSEHPPGKDTEDDDRDVSISFEPTILARRYRVGLRETENLPLPDWRPFSQREVEKPWKDGVSENRDLIAALRPRDLSGLLQYLKDDIATVAAYCENSSMQAAVVVPLDFDDLQAGTQVSLIKQATAAGVWLLVCPESTRTLDGYAREKLSRSRVLPE
jgi:hypothetical protein